MRVEKVLDGERYSMGVVDMGSERVDSTLYNTLMDWLKGKKSGITAKRV